ncbi:MAG TPA: hypothetical protein VF649_01720 [Sphingomonas sp.]|uniref:hypothetical protein n=1 Tax=Sphingomonas sp. TaxID=28214 RepID=UPI002EDAAEE5
MSERAARAAIGVDFPGVAIAEATNRVEGTRLLQVSLPRLEPGPGPATVTYIFAAGSRALTTVKLAWVLPPSATATERASVVAAGLQLAAYFQNARPRPPVVSTTRVTGPDAVSLYAALDSRNAAIEVAANGVETGTTPSRPMPSGPAMLRVTYFADVTNPDTGTPKKAAQ